MNETMSRLEAERRRGDYQVPKQRAGILDAAEALFLRNGLANTSMVNIAAEAHVTKVTLYRYFPNRDAIALAIQVRMMNRIASHVDLGEDDVSLKRARQLAQSMIRNFDLLRDAYRYIGMFDQLYLDHPPDFALTRWTKEQLVSFVRTGAIIEKSTEQTPQGSRFVVVMSTVIWFLEKLALRDELTWSDHAVPLEEHLKSFEEMIVGYIDRSMDEENRIE